jgi:tRNA dimethylallyltransferase
MGPTASGKTGLAEAVASSLSATLINADAFQVYRGLDIGTAKPARRELYKLIDIKNPDEPFGLGEWVKLAHAEIVAAFKRGQSVVVVGGTGLYVRALFEEYTGMGDMPDAELRSELNATPIEELRVRLLAEHPEVAATVDMDNPVRVRRALERVRAPLSETLVLPPFVKLKLGLTPDVGFLDACIANRVPQMVAAGWVEEVSGLRDLGHSKDAPGFRAIGYRAIWDHLDNKISLDEAIAATIMETRRYAKRQRTWLRTERGLVGISATTESDAIRKAMERIESVLM